jgi:hypothetical protein
LWDIVPHKEDETNARSPPFGGDRSTMGRASANEPYRLSAWPLFVEQRGAPQATSDRTPDLKDTQSTEETSKRRVAADNPLATRSDR